MMAGSFTQGGWFLQSTVPIKKSGGAKVELPPGVLPDETQLELRIDNSPDGFKVLMGDIRIIGDRELLKRQLGEKLTGFQNAGTPQDKVQVVLMPGRNVKYNNIVAVYEAALRAGFTKVGFATSH
jgi:biopolymer transport protein ExbD